MENNNLQKLELSREEILDLADANGRKLGVLLATSALTDDLKGALIGILQYATPKQLDALINMMEDGLIGAASKEADDFLKIELAALKRDYDKAGEKLDKDILSKLELLENKIKRSS